jgi:uncharacterized protein YraI
MSRTSPIRFLATRTLPVLLACSVCSLASAQAINEGVESAKQIFEGKILGRQVTIRSGPSENYYPVTRLDDGATVIVNGIKFDWLRISPPEGTFSLIFKDLVEVNGSTGRVKSNGVNVRAGSNYGPQYSTVQTKLMRGDTVTVLGQVETKEGVYLKIKPPPGAYLFVKKEFVTPVRALGPAPAEPVRRTPTTPEASTSGTGTSHSPTPPTTQHSPRPSGTSAGTGESSSGNGAYGGGVAGDFGGGTSLTTPPAIPRTTDSSSPPTTQESARMAAEQAYDEADRAWRDASDKPLEEQPLPELLARFEALASNEDLPITLRKDAQSTAAFIKARNANREELLDLKRQQSQMQARLQPLKDQNKALVDQYRQLAQTTYTAAGQLQQTTLQEGGYQLLRLVDPGTGRALVYVRSTDTSYVNSFVGIKGTLSHDDKLNITLITPASIQPIDPNALGRGITAEIAPPSLRLPPPPSPAPASPAAPSNAPQPVAPTTPPASPSTQPVTVE